MSVHPSFFQRIGKHDSSLGVCGLEVDTPILHRDGLTSEVCQSFGTIDCGLELMTSAWSGLEHRFSIRRNREDGELHTSDPHILLGPHRVHSRLLALHPVDLLVVDQGHLRKPVSCGSPSTWESLVVDAPSAARPLVVIELWSQQGQSWTLGPSTKAPNSRWQALGYQTRCRLLRSTELGGAIHNHRFVVVRVRRDLADQWRWASEEAAPSVVRPMGNLLTPPWPW